jgi:hypothetical protein
MAVYGGSSEPGLEIVGRLRQDRSQRPDRAAG